MACSKLDYKLCGFLVDNIKVEQFALDVNGHVMPLTPNQVGYILGLRTSGLLVSEEGPLDDIEDLCQRHGFRGGEPVTISSLEGALSAKDAVLDVGFREKLVLFLLGTMLCPNSSLTIPTHYLHLVKDIDRVCKYNWALFVFEKLRDAVIAYKLHPSRSYICGCIYFLQV